MPPSSGPRVCLGGRVQRGSVSTRLVSSRRQTEQGPSAPRLDAARLTIPLEHVRTPQAHLALRPSFRMLARPVRLVTRLVKVAQLDLVAQIRDADDADLDDLRGQDAREAVLRSFACTGYVSLSFPVQSGFRQACGKGIATHAVVSVRPYPWMKYGVRVYERNSCVACDTPAPVLTKQDTSSAAWSAPLAFPQKDHTLESRRRNARAHLH